MFESPGWNLPDYRTTQLSGEKVNKIVSKGNGTYTRRLVLHDENGENEIFFNNNNNGDTKTFDIPENQHIVGLFGQAAQGSNLYYLGFILAEF